MPAYKLKLAKPSCDRCGLAATHEVFDSHNARRGWYCELHAKVLIVELDDARDRHNKRVMEADEGHSAT